MQDVTRKFVRGTSVACDRLMITHMVITESFTKELKFKLKIKNKASLRRWKRISQEERTIYVQCRERAKTWNCEGLTAPRCEYRRNRREAEAGPVTHGLVHQVKDFGLCSKSS